ncbi:TfoX/Sxy family protein [Bosea thiooxidans]
MDADDLREVFVGVMPVRVRRMFGGHGIYDGEIMFALEQQGEIYLKADAESEGRFAAAGSAAFVYSRGAKPFAMSYWRLPDTALDDEDELRQWTGLALAAARRAAASPLKPRGSRSRSRPR